MIDPIESDPIASMTVDDALLFGRAHAKVYQVIHAYPPLNLLDPLRAAVENARVWRAVSAALDVAKPAMLAADVLKAQHAAKDVDGFSRCGVCVAGYSRETGDLVFAAWPCITAAALIRAGVLTSEGELTRAC